MVVSGVYSMLAPRKILAGMGSIENLPSIVKEFGVDNVLIVTDQGVWNAGLVEKPVELLERSGIRVDVIHEVSAEPEIGQVKDVFNQAVKSDCQVVIGIGGGSAMDTAKLVSVLLTNGGNLEDLPGIEKITVKGLPSIMVPTTAGTGSEATQNAIVTLPEQELKVGIVSSKLVPDCVILDPFMTVKLPPAVTASTGMDAFTHAMECFISNKANPFSDTFALKAMKLIWGSIRRAYKDGSDMIARHDMLLGSFYGGMCIASSGTAAVHALAYPLGGRYRIPHGVSNAMLLPHVTEFNRDAIEEQLKTAAVEMGIVNAGTPALQASKGFVGEIFTLVGDLNIPCSLKQFGIKGDDLETLVEAAAKVTRLLDNNPKVLTKEDMRNIYRKLL